MMRCLRLSLAALIVGGALISSAGAQDLGTFGVLAGSTVTNTGTTVINGNVGVSPGNAITGFFPPGIVTAPYTIHNNDAVAAAAQAQLTTAYNVLAGRLPTADLTGQDLGNRTLTAGVYNFASTAGLTGALTLDGGGDPNAVFIFNVGSDLTTASGSSVLLINGANANNVFFRVGASATLGSTTAFQGKILALSSITLVTGATINCGAALARNGAVTLDTNVIGICPLAAVVIGDGGITFGNGPLPIGFAVLAVLTPEEQAEALRQLSGQTAPGGFYGSNQAMASFLGLLASRTGPMAANAPAEAPGQGTVSVMGYADSPAAPGGGAFSGFDGQGTMPDVARWDIWAGTYGQYEVTKGNGTTTVDRTSAAYGLAFGFERAVTADTMFGLAISGGGTNFNLDDSLGSGHSAMLQAAAYGRVDSDRAYLSGAVAYGIHDMQTDRYVRFAGLDHFTARYVMQDVAGQIEAGYHMGALTPFAGLSVQSVSAPGYSETTASGNSTYALAYAAKTVLSARTQIGVRADWSKPLENGILSLHASAAWAHTFETDRRITASFQALPGSSFTVSGAAKPADAILLSLGAGLEMQTGLALGVSVDTSISGGSQSYSGSAHLGYSW